MSESAQQFPEPTVGALIFNDRDQLLIVKTHKWNGNYTIPGGHVEMGERLKEAVKREVWEETGLKMTQAHFLCHQQFIYDDSFWQKRHFIFFDFVCRVEDGDVRLNEEAEEFVWVDLDSIDDYPIDKYLKYALEELRSNPGLLE